MIAVPKQGRLPLLGQQAKIPRNRARQEAASKVCVAIRLIYEYRYAPDGSPLLWAQEIAMLRFRDECSEVVEARKVTTAADRAAYEQLRATVLLLTQAHRN